MICVIPNKRLPRWRSGRESACQCRRHGRHRFYHWVRKISWDRKWQPTPVTCLENLVNRGAWWAPVHRVAKGWTQMKRLSTNEKQEVLKPSRALWGFQTQRPLCPPFLIGKTSAIMTFRVPKVSVCLPSYGKG